MRHLDQLEERRQMRNSFKNEEKFFGGMVIAIVLLNVAWIGFLAWAIYTIVTYFTGG